MRRYGIVSMGPRIVCFGLAALLALGCARSHPATMDVSTDPHADDPRLEAKKVLSDHLARDGKAHPLPDATADLVALMNGSPGTDRWHSLDAALALALRADRRAIPFLRQMLVVPISSSVMEAGLAALGLALLGDVDSRGAIANVTPINGNAARVTLALRVLAR